MSEQARQLFLSLDSVLQDEIRDAVAAVVENPAARLRRTTAMNGVECAVHVFTAGVDPDLQVMLYFTGFFQNPPDPILLMIRLQTAGPRD